MTRVVVEGTPQPGGCRTKECWSQHVQILMQEPTKELVADWHIVVFGDTVGSANHSKLVVLGSPIGSVVFGRTWIGRWKLTPWPEDLTRSHFAKLLTGHYTLWDYAESLDAALSGLSRKVTVADVRRVRARLRQAPWGDASWLVLKMLVRENLDPSLYGALDGYVKGDRAVLLPWLRPHATRAIRMWALRELEPAAIRLALLQRAGLLRPMPVPHAGQKLLESIDVREPLRKHACEMLALTSAQVRWLNQVAGSPRTPSSLLPDICAVLAHMPPDIRPQTHAELVARQSLVKLASEHQRVLFCPELEGRLPAGAIAPHRHAFQRSCIPLFKRPHPLKVKGVKSRAPILKWLATLEKEQFLAAHLALCKMGFLKRETLFYTIGEWTCSSVRSLPVYVEQMSQCADAAWAQAAKECGGPPFASINPQHWASQNIHGTETTTYFWPTSPEEMKSTGRIFSNCLLGLWGPAYWLDLVTGRQLLVAITTRLATGSLQSLAAISISSDTDDAFKLAVVQHYGVRNEPPAKSHVPLARRLQSRIASELQRSPLLPYMLHTQRELCCVDRTAAGDVDGWRSQQIDMSCRSALLKGGKKLSGLRA